MSKLSDTLLCKESQSALLMGNYAVARGMLEAGVRVATTYPGSPTPEIAAALSSVPPEQRTYYFEYSTNEKVALEVAAGASMNGHLSTVFFKSVGLNVASDALIQLPMMELIGGMVVILGDDPGANSSQNEQDNRHFSRMSYLSMLEPASPQEAYEMFLEAARLAKALRTAVLLRLTTHVCHAKELVRFSALTAEGPDWTPRFDRHNGPYVPIVADVHPLKLKALRKLAALSEESETSRFNGLLQPCASAANDGSRLGLISASIPANSAYECVLETGAKVDILKLGFTYPLPRKKLAQFLSTHDEVLIFEELDRVMELEIKALAFDEGLSCRVHTRSALEELQGEYDPKRAFSLLSRIWPKQFPPKPAEPIASECIAPRLPQMCPGCGHRSAFHAVKAALEKADITVADIGCHSLGYLPPYNMGEMLYCMGASPGLAAGLSLHQKSRKVVAFIGDSTMFHAGLPGLLNAVLYNHDFTLILLENGTTAMTGHQVRAGSGEIGEKINIPSLLETLGVKFLRDVDAYNQAKLTATVKEAMAHEGFSLVIARHPCMLKFVRDQQKKNPGFKMQPVRIDQDTCDHRMTCVAEFGCPSFVRHDDGSVTVHEELCIGDGSCLPTCPVQAIGRPKTGGAK
ncbi:MAG: thiamine pyrophosphate-dependent enzyme [Myxococcota bacterium]|jgi:indolepyruvate ferredoxin oxidoreductase alpha subunit|nr:thiamine pyrophosphate-dependent enzyme [Myxococcota bacterium]